ncbi:MAG: hypothetical protein IPM24_26845 [Bryobacterales bacterium]|nr:hypothetical protein [Bryobacterales bacterium]
MKALWFAAWLALTGLAGPRCALPAAQEERITDADWLRVWAEMQRRDSSRRVAAERRAAAEEVRRFHEAASAFAEAWNAFAAEYLERGTLNVRKLKEVRKAWRRLEPLLYDPR